MPQPVGVLFVPDSDLFDYGPEVYAQLPVLRGGPGAFGTAGSRRTGKSR